MALASTAVVFVALLASHCNPEALTQPPARDLFADSPPELSPRDRGSTPRPATPAPGYSTGVDIVPEELWPRNRGSTPRPATPAPGSSAGVNVVPEEAQLAAEPEDLSTAGVIQYNKYDVESHVVETVDDYTLTMFRIPNAGRPAVFLQHGLMDSSTDWVITGRGRALAFLLHDAGYDVWLGNLRGNVYSRKHRKLTSADKEFWNFSWHENGVHDIPAMLDYVLEKTNRSSAVYVGHSEGTTSFLVTASMKPEYNKKVSAFVALAPTAYMNHPGSPILRFLLWANQYTEKIYSALGWHEFLSIDQPFIKRFQTTVCSRSGPFWHWICSKVVLFAYGFNEEQVDKPTILKVLKTVPAGASIKAVTHYAQLFLSGKFRQFDYGEKLNKEKYGQSEPPEYQLEDISLPVHLYYSDKDDFATPEDVATLRQRLGNVRTDKRIAHATFNHLDFMYGRDAKKLVLNDVLTVIQHSLQETGTGKGMQTTPRHTTTITRKKYFKKLFMCFCLMHKFIYQSSSLLIRSA